MKRGLAILIILLVMANMADASSYSSKDENKGVEYDFHKYFDEYFTYDTMMDVLNILEAKHPEIMRLYDLTAVIDKDNRMGIPTSTWEERSVWAIKVSDEVDAEPVYRDAKFYSDPTEPDIMIVGAHHGNEWPSFEVTMYFLFYLLENYGMPPTDNDGDELINEDPWDSEDNDGDGAIDEDPIEGRATWLVDNREIWIIPMFNPDGVANDKRTNGRDEAYFGPAGGTVPSNGVDVNRNYPFMWHREPDPQTGPTMDSSNPQSSTYRGPDDNFDDDGDSLYPYQWRPSGGTKNTLRKVDEDPVDNLDNDNDGKIDEDRDGGFSEPETVAMRNLILGVDGNNDEETDIITSISFHTYGGMILYPWGYTSEASPHDDLLAHLASEMAGFNGYDDMVGTELYPVSGELDDWLYGKHTVIPFTFELDSENHKGNIENMINISQKNLPCELYLAEMAPLIEVARERFIGSLDIGLPQINHTQKRKFVNSDNTFPVEVEISNYERLEKNSVILYYRIGEVGEWKTIEMREIDDGRYKATIPKQSGGKKVSYYIGARANYNEAKSVKGNIDVFSPKYGESDPHTYFVDMSLGDTFGDIAAMIIMMALVFGIIYSGLGKSLKMAVEAEKRKSTV